MPVVINGSTGISGIDGSATTPSFKGSDADTGIFYSPSGNVGITINSTQRVLVDTTGNTAITGNTTVSGTLNVASNIASNGIVSDNIGSLRIIPTSSQSSVYSLVAADVGKMITTTANVLVPNAVFSAGDNITIYNNSSSTIYLVSNSGITMYLSGTATTGDRALAQRGISSIFCVAANTFVASGGGLS
jgi:hypothetical protein